jgi:hypothetical protein
MMKYRSFFLLLVLCFIGSSSFAQIEGGVTDKNGKPVSKVVITATDSTGVIAETVLSDERGFYFFSNLKMGKYKIDAKMPALHAIMDNINVQREMPPANQRKKDISSSTRLDIILEPDK